MIISQNKHNVSYNMQTRYRGFHGNFYACRRDRATCLAKTVSQLRYTRSNVPITGLTDKLTRLGKIKDLFNQFPSVEGNSFETPCVQCIAEFFASDQVFVYACPNFLHGIR